MIALRRAGSSAAVRRVLAALGVAIVLLLGWFTADAQSNLLPGILAAVLIALAAVFVLLYRRPEAVLAAAAVYAVLTGAALALFPTNFVAQALSITAFALLVIAAAESIVVRLRAVPPAARMAERSGGRGLAPATALAIAIVPAALGALLALRPSVVWGAGSLAQLWWLAAPHSPLLWKLAVAADALAGGVAVFIASTRLGAGATGGATAAFLWTIAPARLAPEGLHLLPTFLLPAFFASALDWRRRRVLASLIFAAIAGALAIVAAPALAIAMIIVTFGALIDEPLRRWFIANWRPAISAAAVITIVAIALHARMLTALGSSGTLVGASVADVVRKSGGDGAYPWELLFPSLTSGLGGHWVVSLLRLTAHWGDALTIAIAPGWAALLFAIVGFASARDARSRRIARFFAACIALSLAAALPAYAYGVPLPTLAALAALASSTFAGAAQFGLGATLAIVLAAAFGVTQLAAARNSRVTAVMATVAGLALILDAIPNPGLQTSPARTARTQAVSWSAVQSAGHPVAYYPLVSVDEPVSAVAAYAASVGRATLLSSPLVSPRLSNVNDPAVARRLRQLGVRYVVVDEEAYDSYLIGAAGDQVALPPDVATPTWRSLQPAGTMLPGMTPQRFFENIDVYRLP